jgi:hypothetical protein
MSKFEVTISVQSFIETSVLARFFSTGMTVLALLGMAACTTPIPEDAGSRAPAQLVGFSTPLPKAKDFVVAARTDRELDYIPVGVTPADRPIKVKTEAELAAYQKELDTQRTASSGYATRPAPAMRPLAQPRKLPPIPGSRLLSNQPDALPGKAQTFDVPPRLRPKRIDEKKLEN